MPNFKSTCILVVEICIYVILQLRRGIWSQLSMNTSPFSILYLAGLFLSHAVLRIAENRQKSPKTAEIAEKRHKLQKEPKTAKKYICPLLCTGLKYWPHISYIYYVRIFTIKSQKWLGIAKNSWKSWKKNSWKLLKHQIGT